MDSIGDSIGLGVTYLNTCMCQLPSVYFADKLPTTNIFLSALKASFIFSQCTNYLNCITYSRLRIWMGIYSALVAMVTSAGFAINFAINT